MDEIKKSIELLRSRLLRWEYLYYVKDHSEISDEKYDQYMEVLRVLENRYPDLITSNSPTQRILKGNNNCFRSIRHTVPMLSLDNIFDKDSLLNFDRRIRTKLKYDNVKEIVYCCELKVDGVGVNIIYEDGVLMHAATRGDGSVGEDITKNICTIKSIPLCLRQSKILPKILEIRGEVFMSNLSFLRLNKFFIKKGVKTFSNPRNAVSGSLRQINSSVTSKRSLDFFCYHVAHIVLSDHKEQLFDTHWEQIQQCGVWGIPILENYTQVCVGINEVFQYFKNIQKIRSSLNFNIDGIVVKVNSIILQKSLGMSSRAPRWAMSYKFPAKKAISKLCNVHFHVNRIGILIPVASLTPVAVSGIIIQNATLHNIDFIRRLDLMIGDSVVVERSGDVIPKITQVVLSDRVFNEVRPVIYPNSCPVCQSSLSHMNFKSGFFLRCNAGLYCFAQQKGVLKHFVSRKAMNIVGMGDKIIDKLIKSGLLRTPVDFFQLNLENLICIDGIKEKLAQRLLNSIEVSRTTTLIRLIYALGIPNVGEITSAILAEFYGSIKRLIDADIISLLAVKDIGFVVAHNVFNFFKSKHNLRVVDKLLLFVKLNLDE